MHGETTIQAFEALSVETLGGRLERIPAVAQRVGSDSSSWKVREVGDGNLNLVFIVEGPKGAVVVKQALPYVRLVGDSWPLPLKRSFFEYHALSRQAERDPGMVPEIFHFDAGQAIIVMEFLSPAYHFAPRPHRRTGCCRKLPGPGPVCRAHPVSRLRPLPRHQAAARLTSRSLPTMSSFATSPKAWSSAIPIIDAKLNRHTSPQLDGIVAGAARRPRPESGGPAAEASFRRQGRNASAWRSPYRLGDGDGRADTRVIDPEFAFYGPMAFDVGMLLANFWMSYFSQSGHETAGNRASMRRYLLGVTVDIWSVFRQEFARLWRSERTGILYQRCLFEEQGDMLASEQALDLVLHGIWVDMLGFAGVEMHRRILGLAHNADFETIEDADLRARCERQALNLGRHLAVNRATFTASRKSINWRN